MDFPIYVGGVHNIVCLGFEKLKIHCGCFHQESGFRRDEANCLLTVIAQSDIHSDDFDESLLDRLKIVSEGLQGRTDSIHEMLFYKYRCTREAGKGMHWHAHLSALQLIALSLAPERKQMLTSVKMGNDSKIYIEEMHGLGVFPIHNSERGFLARNLSGEHLPEMQRLIAMYEARVMEEQGRKHQ